MGAPEGTVTASRPDGVGERLYDLGFLLVEAFAAFEVTAVIVANARITEALHLREELSSWIINSYLYPLFGITILAMLLSRWLDRRVSPVPLFMGGLGIFAAGNLLCALATGPIAFFTGRAVMGVGGALSFTGQLWTLSVFHRHRITRPLVWGEVGSALGVVSGPVLGALFVHLAPTGWRQLFLLNGFLAICTVLFARMGLKGPVFQAAAAAGDRQEAAGGRRRAWVMTAWQVGVSILVVGMEYLFSDYLQAKLGRSALFVGGLTVLASLGAIAGSAWAARLEHCLPRLPRRAVAGLLLSLAALALCLHAKALVLAGLPIFASGLCMGLASVSTYASIVKASEPTQFLPRSMVYLLGMQIGNALGVQAVGIAELRHLGPLGTALVLGLLPLCIALGAALMERGMGGARKPRTQEA